MIVIILAGGEGKRMNSNLPKVLHILNEKPMIVHVINTALLLNPEKIFVIVGKHYELIKSTIDNYIISNLIDYVYQPIPNGTGGAILSSLNQIKTYENAIILSGDVPLISFDTLKKFDNYNNCILTTLLENPFGMGRIILNNNIVEEIVEEKDCNDLQKNIKLVNCGIYKFQISVLLEYIPKINNFNKNNEYYLTDLINICFKNNINIFNVNLNTENQIEIYNINTQADLEYVKKYDLKK